jgi:hypothetical protein
MNKIKNKVGRPFSRKAYFKIHESILKLRDKLQFSQIEMAIAIGLPYVRYRQFEQSALATESTINQIVKYLEKGK